MGIAFKQIVSDIAGQDNRWRPLAQKCAEYYDHLQITEERGQQLRECDYLDVTGNLIHPTVNSVLGHEEQSRVDWMVTADDMDSEDVAEGLNQKLNEVMRLAEANRHCSEAYKHQIIKGLGWIHVRKNPDPFDACAYIIERIETNEIYWDMRSRDAGLRDCRWMARRKFMDLDEAKILFKGHSDLIDNLANGWMGSFSIGDDNSDYAMRASEYASSSGYESYILKGTRRQQVAVYEVYYRVPTQVRVVRFPDGRVEEYKKGDSDQLLALIMGNAKPEKANIMKMRRKYYIGPHEISDDESPHPHNYFPFIKFEGYTEDHNNTPYGIVRGMLDPQDAYNEAGFEILRILEHRTIIKEEGATDLRDSELSHEVRRRDTIINLKDGKMGTLSIDRDWKDFQALNGLQEKYKAQVQDYSGVNNSYTGQSGSNTPTSGVGIAAKAELGATSLSEINANYQYARKKLGEIVLAYIVDDMADQAQAIRIRNGIGSQVKKTVHLNTPDEQGRLTNVVSQARYQVAIADVQSSVGYRQNLNMRVMEMFQVSAQDQTMHRFLLEMAIETSELPRREEMLEKWRKLNGMSDDPEQQAHAQQQQMQATQQAQQIEQAKVQAKVAKDNGDAQLNQAKAAKELYEIEMLKQAQEERQAMAKSKPVNDAWANQARGALEAA